LTIQRAFVYALAAAALKVREGGGPAIELLAEGQFLFGAWGLRFEGDMKGHRVKRALLMYVDQEIRLYTDFAHPIRPAPGAFDYDGADVNG
jgi:hypothetical protein